MSSGSETRQRRHLLPVRCTAEEAAELRAAKDAAGFASMAEFIRTRCLKATRSPKVRPVERQQLARVLGELGKWGSNLNQLAHAANMDEPVSRAEFEELAGHVRQASAAVMEALGRGRQG